MPDGSRQNPPLEAFRFAAAANLGKPDKEGRRAFSGVAYSGDVIQDHWYWGNLVMDCSTTKAAASIPMLLDHKTDKIAGTGAMTFGNSMNVAGQLSGVTDSAKTVAQLADEGFPWQMSVNVEPGSIEEVGAGIKCSVNGRDFTGPLTIFRQNTIRETSFCAVGADAQTSAQVFTRTREGTPTMPAENKPASAPTIESLTEQLAQAAANVTRLTGERDALKVECDGFRKTQLTAAFKTRGKELTDEAAKPYLSMSGEQFTAALEFIAPVATTVKRDPKLFTGDDPAASGEGGDPQAAKNARLAKAKGYGASATAK